MSKKLAQDASLRAKTLNVMHPAYIWPSIFMMYMTISFFCRLYALPPKTPSKSLTKEATTSLVRGRHRRPLRWTFPNIANEIFNEYMAREVKQEFDKFPPALRCLARTTFPTDGAGGLLAGCRI